MEVLKCQGIQPNTNSEFREFKKWDSCNRFLPEKFTHIDFWDSSDCLSNHSDVGLSF